MILKYAADLDLNADTPLESRHLSCIFVARHELGSVDTIYLCCFIQAAEAVYTVHANFSLVCTHMC